MKRDILLILMAMLGIAGVALAKGVKQPDSYAYTRGAEAYAADEYADALQWFERELADHPDNGYAYCYIGTIRYSNNEFGLALSAINNSLKYLPKKDNFWRALSHNNLAEVHVAIGDTVKALEDLSQAIRLQPETIEYYSERADVYYEQQKFDLADADYRKIIEIDPGNIIGYMGLGRNAKDQENYDEAIRQFDQAIRLAPEMSRCYAFRAECYLIKKDWAKATDDIVKALDVDGDDKAFYLMKNIPDVSDEGADLLGTKLKIQMAAQPSNAYWPYCLAVLAQNRKDYNKAIEYYEMANSIDANSAFLEYISRCYYNQEHYYLALDYADRALDMSPEDYDVIDLKADILSEMGRFDECLAERDRIVAKYPDNASARVYRANARMLARRFGDAIEDYEAAMALAPVLAEFPYLLMKRGDAYRLSGKTDLARRDYETLLEVEKDSALTADSWTPFAYTGLGDADKAIETMRYIVDNDTTDIARSLYNMACIYSRLGRTQDALLYLRKAVDNGMTDRIEIETDYDLDALRDLPEFREFINSCTVQVYDPVLVDDENVVYEVVDVDDNGGPYEIPVIDPNAGPYEIVDMEESFERVEVPFTKENGVTKVKCTINGLPLHFVFDTGAADVTMSMVEANFMVKNDFIKPEDIIGSARYMDANGDITEGTVVNLRKVDFGGLELENVRARVVRNQKAPLLLGQSVLGRLGKIEIDNPGMKLVITHKVR